MDSRPEASSADTVALGPDAAPVSSSASRPRTPPSHHSIEDEGRFVPGTLLAGRYRIIGLLGRGGMGEVYRATDLMLGQSVALKFLPETASASPLLLERFHGEVRVARQVSHPNVCRVYDIGETEGLPFISMEYVDGEDLATLLQRIGRLPAAKALETARQICAGLAAAHARGVIHRDLKPQNIMMNRRGEVMIMDFGLAAFSDRISGIEARHGTPAYMSPEQLKGGEVTPRSDIYALGLVLYELFTGKRPYEASSLQQLIDQQESLALTSMTSIAAETDPAVERVIRRCLQPDPSKRPDSALAVSAALPGGDPLAAALAAGETPSPDLVASAGGVQGLGRRYALACLAAVLITVAAMPFIKQHTTAFFRAGLEYPPDVLHHKARELASLLGSRERPADSVLWLNQRRLLLAYLASLPDSGQRDQWLASEAPLSATYRESSRFLVALPSGYVAEDNPPPIEQGMSDLEIDGHGRLRGFSAMPASAAAALSPAVEPETVFLAAGLDLGSFAEVTPATVPRTATDQLRAWKGPHPGIPNTSLTVEAGWWRGRVTHVRLIWPWTGNSGPRANPLLRIGQTATLALACAGIVFVALLARRNWKLNRTDRRGALRIATVIFAVRMIGWAGSAHLVPSGAAFLMFFGALSEALLPAALLWLLYLALEPAVRSRWPHSMVTWSRLLSGRWDPHTAGHILIGAAIGSLLILAATIPDSWVISGPGLSTTGGLYILNGTRQWIAHAALRLSESIQLGMVVFFVIFCFRTLLKRDWIAAVASAVLFAALQSDVANSSHALAAFALYFIVYAGIAFVLLRFGLLVSVSAVYFLNSINSITLGTDWTAWNAPAGLAAMGLSLALALWAFQRSLGNHGLMGSDT